MRTKSRYRPKGQERATLSLDASGGTEQRPLYTTNRASWLSIVSATHLDFNASIVVTRPFISYGFYRRRCCRCGNIPNDVQPPSDGCDDKSSESIATQAARWRVPSGRFSRLDSDSIDRSACDNSHNRSRVFVLDRLEDVPRLVEHLNFGTECVSLGKLIYLAVACDITRSPALSNSRQQFQQRSCLWRDIYGSADNKFAQCDSQPFARRRRFLNSQPRT